MCGFFGFIKFKIKIVKEILVVFLKDSMFCFYLSVYFFQNIINFVSFVCNLSLIYRKQKATCISDKHHIKFISLIYIIFIVIDNKVLF